MIGVRRIEGHGAFEKKRCPEPPIGAVALRIAIPPLAGGANLEVGNSRLQYYERLLKANTIKGLSR